MNSARLIATAMLVCAATLACGTAGAQPHVEPEISFKASLPVTEPAQVAEWLQRLVGKFKYDGMVQMGECAPQGSAEGGPPPPPSDMCQGIKGISDCIEVGKGAGVQCILNVTWQDIFAVDFQNGTVREVLVSYLDPAMELYGLDPGNLGMSRLMVNNKGIGEGGTGLIKGNTATFSSLCANSSVQGCFNIVRFEAKPDAKLLYVWFGAGSSTESWNTIAVMTLRRVLPEEASPAATLKPASLRRK